MSEEEPRRGIIKAFDPDGEEVEGPTLLERELEMWPQGNKEPANGWNPYYKGIWLVAELGLMRARSQCLLVRAVTSQATQTKLAGVEENTLRALAYEVVDIADDWPIDMLYHSEHNPSGLKRGDHIVHLSASQDRLDPRDQGCPWFWVEAPDVAGSWDAVNLRTVLDGSAGMTIEELVERARPFANTIRAAAEERMAMRIEAHYAGQLQVGHVQ